METVQDSKSGQEVAKQSGQAKPNRFHVDHWKKRLFKKAYTRGGQHIEVDEWSVRLQHLGRREAFSLNSANASVAAAKAKEIFTFLEANGWDATLAKFKPKPVENSRSRRLANSSPPSMKAATFNHGPLASMPRNSASW